MEFKILKMAQESGVNRIRMEAIVPTKSVIWEERYNDIGIMQAVFDKTDAVMETVRVGKFALIDGADRIMYIYGVKLTDTELWAYGYEAKALLKKAPMYNSGTSDGTVDIGQAITNALSLYNNFSFMQSSTFASLGTGNLDGLEYWSVYEYVQKCLALGGNGWHASYSQSLGKIVLYPDTGIDQSDYYIFSSELGNASGITYAIDNQSYYNRVYAIGKEGDNVVYVYEEDIGEEREVFGAYLDCRSDFAQPEGMSTADYEAALHTRALLSLVQRKAKQTLTVKAIDTEGLNSLYFLGDIVTVAVPEYDVKQKMRIICVRRTIEGGVEKVNIELSKVA